MEIPDWNQIPFKISCARCGNDLQGIREPACPACGFEFDWADVVPWEDLSCIHCGYMLRGIPDGRCPECGKPFTWEEVLTNAYCRRKPLFEYRWHRSPVRSLLKTWLLALWPPKLWSKLDLHNQPQLAPLLFMVTIVILLSSLLPPICAATTQWIYFWYRPSGPAPPTALDFVLMIEHHVWNLHSYDFLPSICSWYITVFAALCLFWQTMSRASVRSVHLVRIVAYSLPTGFIILPLGMTLLSLADTFFNYSPPTEGLFVFSTCWIIHGTWSMYLACKHYLRVPHSGSVTIAAQAIGLLAAGACTYFIFSVKDLFQYFCWIMDILGV